MGFRIRVNEPHEPQALGTRTFLRVPVGEERLHDKEREKLSRTRPLPSFATIRPAPTSVAEAAPRGSLGDSHLAEVALRDLHEPTRFALLTMEAESFGTKLKILCGTRTIQTKYSRDRLRVYCRICGHTSRSSVTSAR